MEDYDARPIRKLVEGVHYYLEDGLMVLTERYHLARGQCRDSGCRHCPFDHVNVNEEQPK